MKLALFDLDYTLLPLDSDHAWGEFTTRIGWTEGEAFRQKNEAFYAQYKAGTLDIHEYVRFSTAAVRRQGPEAAARAHAQFMREVIAPAIRPQALALIEQHRRAGEAVAIVTATNEFITRPIAHALGVDELIAINLERGPGGWFTGEIAGTPSFREGKITRVGQWLAARGLGDELVSVYVPTTPNPTSGYFLLARRADVVDLAMSVDEALKYVISMGVVAPPARAQSAPAAPAISNPVSHSGK